MNNLIQQCKDLRSKYLNDEDRELKLCILTQICSVYFFNNDTLPKVINITINVKPAFKLLYHNSSYPIEIVKNVLSDLNLKYNFNHITHPSAFTFSFEVNFFAASIK